MGLFRFLQKKKAREEFELEAPPPPAQASDFKLLPPFPEEELPPFPELSPVEKSPKKKQVEETTLPEFPLSERVGETWAPIKPQEALKPLDLVLPKFPETTPQWERVTPFVRQGQELEEANILQEHRRVHAREKLVVEKPLFVEGFYFRKILTSLQQLKAMLQEGEEHLAHRNHVEDTKEAHFERLRINGEQLQRKLIYIDKLLFEEKIRKGDDYG